MGQALASLRRGDLARAIAALETVVEAMPDSSEAHRVLATAFHLAGDLEKTVAHLDAALRLRPDDERSWIALVRTRADSGAFPEAVRTLEGALEAVAGSGELRWRLAELLRRLDRNGEALEQYDDAAGAVAISGGGQVQRWVATLASLLQDWDRSLEGVQRRVRLNPNDAAAHRDLATVYMKQGRQDEAFAELVMATWLDPDDPLTLVALGQSHMAHRRDTDAIEALERAILLQPDLQEARYALAQALIRVGRREEWRQQLSEFQRLRAEGLERDRRAGELTVLKSQAARQSLDGQHQAAMQTWMKVIALEPDLAQNYLDLADTLVKAGQLEGSIAYFVKAAELDGVAEVHLRLADVLAQLGRSVESALARDTYERLRLEDFQRGAR
jgi:superkiller protein 3